MPLVAGVLWLAAASLKGNRDVTPGKGETEEAVVAAREFVRQRLDQRVLPKFAPREWITVSRQGEEYVVSRWVETSPKNTNGNSATYDYACMLLKRPDGAWHLTKIDLLPQ